MSRAVYVGGFGNGRANVGRVAEALGNHYEDVDAFTFSDAMRRPETIRRAVKGVDVLTHSAGMLAVRGTQPESVGAIGAPLPSSIARLAARTYWKQLRMYAPGIGVQTPGDLPRALRYDASCMAEFAAHPATHVTTLPAVAAFDAITESILLRTKGTPVVLGYNDGDEYFQPSPTGLTVAQRRGIEVITMPGVHDELVIRPEQCLYNFLNGPRLAA